jgi:hypothetical protein
MGKMSVQAINNAWEIRVDGAGFNMMGHPNDKE